MPAIAWTLLDDAGGCLLLEANQLKVADSGGLSLEKTLTISVIDANETPTDISLDGAGVAENCATGTVIGNLSVADSDAGDRLDAAG
jgi:hypothetical protein